MNESWRTAITATCFMGVKRAGLDVRSAIRVALAADTVSILVMEIVDNAFILAVPGAMEAGLIGRGRGHAVVHQMHEGAHHH